MSLPSPEYRIVFAEHGKPNERELHSRLQICTLRTLCAVCSVVEQHSWENVANSEMFAWQQHAAYTSDSGSNNLALPTGCRVTANAKNIISEKLPCPLIATNDSNSITEPPFALHTTTLLIHRGCAKLEDKPFTHAISQRYCCCHGCIAALTTVTPREIVTR